MRVNSVMIPATPPQRHRVAHALAATQRGHRELMLVQTLQSTLDLEALLALFGAAVGKDIAHDGMRYWHTERGLDCNVGETAANTCSYRLRVDSEDLGELQFFRRRRFVETELMTIETSLAGLLYPLRNALKYREAVEASSFDYLTGTLNRRALDLVLSREVDLARRHGVPFSMVMLDIDHFKAVNTRHGHLAGDQVIRAVARCVMDNTRRSDELFRYGGEEFVLLLSNTDAAGAHCLAEKIRQAVANLRHPVAGDEIAVTLSLGVASQRQGDDSGQLIERADGALRKAKQGGRNQTVLAGQ